MKTFKRFLTLLLVSTLTLSVWGADESVTFSSVYSADDEPTVYNGTNFSITFDKGTNSNVPIYKTTGAAVRIYGGGYFEVSSTTKTINKIELTFGSGDGSNAITTNVDTYTSNTWNGSATSVKFTIGGTSGHRRLASVAVTYASGGGSTKYTVTLSKNGSTTDITDCSGTYTLPTTGEHVADACTDWNFHCWTNASYSESTTAPSTTVITSMTSAGTAYAVYKKTEGTGTSNETINFGYSNWGKTAQYSGTTYNDVTQTKNGITVTQSRNGTNMYANSTATRFYGSNTLTFSSSVGNITSIVFTCSTYQTDITSDVGECTSTSSEFSWTGDASSVTFTRTGSSYAQFTEAIVSVSSGTTTYTSTPACVTPTEVTVTFDANGGTGTMTPQVMDYNTATALTANTFTREGYTFQGWATSASGSKVYNDGASVTLKKNTILYAVWQVNSHNVTFTPDPTGATVTINSQSTSPQSANYGTTVTIAITPATHYTIGSVTAIGAISSTNIPLNGTGNTRTFTMPDEDVNVTVTMTAETSYTVTWSMNGDESTKEIYYEGQSIVFPASADGCDGKTFMGWSAVPVAEQDDAPTYTTSATMPAHSVTYYAVYAEAEEGTGSTATYTFEITSSDFTGSSYDDNNGSHSSTATDTSNPSNTMTVLWVSNNVSNNTGMQWRKSNSYIYNTTNLGKINSVTVTGDALSQYYGSSEEPSNTSLGISDGYFKVANSTSGALHTSSITVNFTVTSGGGTSYSGYTTTCGAGISAKNIGWMTTAQGQKVKRVINVSAKNFDDPTTLTATCANSNFTVTLGETAVPAGATGLTTTLTVEYTPTASNTREENVEIVLTAGDKTRTITVSGRSVPDEFLLITKKSSTWYALPANMTGGAGEYDGVEVSPNDNTTPTVVSVSPSTLIYTLSSVADSRYADNGNLVRLVGNDNKCLWGNKATGATKVNIQNYAQLGATNGDNYEWDLVTTDGVHYFVESPCNAEYADGRRLAYGSKFGMYKEETVFFIVKAGCSSQPGDVLVSPRRVDATFSWVSNSSTMHIDLYTNEGMTTGHLSATASSSPYVFNGLEETTDYWYRLTPGEDTDCAVTGTFKTTGPIIDIVEWEENGVVLFIDKGDINPLIVIDGQEEHGSITGGGNATELFFAKYFEGAGEMKLLSIFNGTQNDIDFTGSHEYVILQRSAGSSATTYSSNITVSGTTYNISTLGPNDKKINLNSLGKIRAGQEIIFFTRPQDICNEKKLYECSNAYLEAMSSHNKVTDNPRWIELSSSATDNGMNFNGNDALILLKDNVAIDVFGAASDPAEAQNHKNCRNEVGWIGTIKNMDYGKTAADFPELNLTDFTLEDYSIDVAHENIDIHTARCILFRNKEVTSGVDAVANNTSNFSTLTTGEWVGRSVCKSSSDCETLGWTYSCGGMTYRDNSAATCNSYQDLAAFNYNKYYIDWTNIDPGKELSKYTSDPETKEYTIPIDNMRQYACLNLRFQLKMGDEVLTEASQQVPIVVTGNVDTNDPLFSELVVDQSTHLPSYSHSVTRCSTCDVVVLGSATLTKEADGAEKDVPAVGNVKVYPGGQLIVPDGTHYTVNSLAFRRQEDEVATADIQGNLNITASDATYFDLRVDPTNWHYITLPFDVKVSDIRFANPAETSVPVLGSDYLLKWYDGEKRAATQAAGSWTMVDPGATLKKGLGYIFSIPGDGKVKREFRFPMSNEVIEEEKGDKMVTGVYGYGCDKSFEEVRANHRGWNMLGNPYLLPYTCDISTPLETGLIVEDHSTDPWNGHFKFDEDSRTAKLRYIVEPVDNGWSEYRQVSVTDIDPMKPFTCYFVQIGGTDPSAPQGIDFHLAKVNRSSIVRRSPAEYEEEPEDTHPVWCAVTLTNTKGETDETTVLVSNDFTDGYDIMDDLIKWRGTYYQYTQITTRPVLASRNSEGEMAFNALPDSSAAAGIPLNYFAATNGEYTFRYDDKYGREEVTAVMLWDKTTNQWYDLMSDDYTFTSNRTDNKDRFKLIVRVQRKKPQITTGCETVTAGETDRPRKLLINGHVYIQRGGAIYDVTGKEVSNF